MKVVVRFATSTGKTRSLLLRANEIVSVGRRAPANYPIVDASELQDVHFQIDCSSFLVRVKGMSEDAGLLLDGSPISESTIVDGQVLRAGGIDFQFGIDGARDEREPKSETPVVEVAPTRHMRDVAQRLVPDAVQLPYQQGLCDADHFVRSAAMVAAIVSKANWILEYCRAVSECPIAGHWLELNCLAVLGTEKDWPRLAAAVNGAELGPWRYSLWARFGHPDSFEAILKVIDNGPEADRAAAGAAYARLTGADIESDEAVLLPPLPPSLSSGISDEAVERFLPDRDATFRHWQEHQATLLQAGRLCQGIDVRQSSHPHEGMDLESCWETSLRNWFYGAATDSIDRWLTAWPQLTDE